MAKSETKDAEIEKVYTVDLRSLALLRIGVGTILFIDLIIRLSDLSLFYTDAGALPRDYLFHFCWNKYYLSLHTLGGSFAFEAFLFSLALIAAIFLTAGIYTRVFTIISWVLLISLQNRDPLILQGGDEMLRSLLFWGIFLPWNHRYAWDVRRLSKKKRIFPNESYSGIPALGYLLLIFSVYFFSGLLKNADEWRTEGTALYYAFSLDMMAYPTAKFFLQYPELLRWATRTIVYIEILAPAFLLIPDRKGRTRLLFISLITLLHLSIAATLFVGLFWIIGIISLAGLIPSSFMNVLEQKAGSVFGRKKNPVQQTAANESLPVFNPPTGKFQFMNVLLFAVVLYELIWNITNMPFFPVKLSNTLKIPAYAFRLDQNWGMFAPTVFKDDGWFVYEGITGPGNSIDLRQNGKTVSYSKPVNEVFNYKNDRWRKYSENYLFISNSPLRPPFCNYLMEKWNSHHRDEQIDSLSIIYFKEPTLPPSQKPTVSREVLCTCIRKKN